VLPAFVLALTKVANAWMVCADSRRMTAIHVFALNLIAPQIVGPKVRLLMRWRFDFAAVLGLGLGRMVVLAIPINGDAAGDLRSHGIVEAGGKVVER